MIEEWRPVIGFEGLYEVSDFGRVRSLDRTTETVRGMWTYKGMDMKRIEHASWKGRATVTLSRGGQQWRRLVSHLVAEAWIGPRPPGTLLRHLDDDPTNDRVDNLMYGTDSQNGFDRGRNGIDYMRNKSACPRGHALEVPNLVGAQVRRGYRTCLACSRATANKRRHPEIDFVATANAHYAKIMTQAGKTAP